MRRALRAFLALENGETSIEYVLIAAVMVAAIIAAVPAIGTNIMEKFNAVAKAF